MTAENQPDYEPFENYIRGSFGRLGLPVDRCSQVLFSQLAHMPPYRGVNLPFQFVQSEIQHLEGNGSTSTKSATPFSKRGKLAGFWHKHFCVPGYEHLGVNASIAWEFDKPGSTKFTDMTRKIAAPYADVEQTKDDLLRSSREIAQAVVYGPGGLQERQASAKATGDWIVYAPHKGQNYYLCISKHDEDEFILEALKQCGIQYSFVSSLLNAYGST